MGDDMISTSDPGDEINIDNNIQKTGSKEGNSVVRKRNKLPQEEITDKTKLETIKNSQNTEKNKVVAVNKSDEDAESWNKNLQTIFEWALRQYPKGTDQRWDKIAGHIPGKTKACITLI